MGTGEGSMVLWGKSDARRRRGDRVWSVALLKVCSLVRVVGDAGTCSLDTETEEELCRLGEVSVRW